MTILKNVASFSLLTVLLFFGASFTFDLFAPPVYGQTAGAWNIHRQGAGNDLNFYYGLSGLTALQLNTGGDMRARRVVDFDSSNFVTDPGSLSVMSGIRLGDSATFTGQANTLTVRRAGADSAPYINLINEGTVTQTIRSGGAGLRKDLIFTNDAGGNYSFSGDVTAPSFTLPANGSKINFPVFDNPANTSYTGFAAGGNMTDGIPWYFGIGREPGAWGEPYRNLIMNNHTGIALSTHGGFAQGGVSIWEEFSPPSSWAAKSREVARFKHDDYGGSKINGKLNVNFGNGDTLLIYQPALPGGDDQLALQTTLNAQGNTGYGDDYNNRLILQPVTGLVGIGVKPMAKLDLMADGDDTTPVIRMRQSGQSQDNTYGYDMGIDNNSDGGLYFYRVSNGAQAITMRLRRDTGFVGIRTTDLPQSDLHIKQNINSQTYGGGIRLERSDNGGFAQIFEGSDQQLHLFTNSNSNYCVVTISNSINCPSDRRIKDNILPLTDPALNKINQLKPSIFTLKSTGLPSVGFIAQDVLDVIPEVVDYSETTGYYGISDALITPYIVKSIQELDAKTSENKNAANLKIQQLEEQVVNQQQQIDLLRKELEALK